MANASVLIADIQRKFGDTAGNFADSTILLTWLDEAQGQFCDDLYPLVRTKGYTISDDQDSITIPSNMILIEVATVTRGLRRTIRSVKPGEWENQRSMVQNAVGYPVIFTQKDNRIYFWPRFESASLTTTTGASISTTTTTVLCATTGNLRSFGRVTIDSESIEYTNKNATSILGCTRGVGGTTAATHASAATVTQEDFELTYRRSPDALTATTAPEIPDNYHTDLEYYCLYLLHKSEGNDIKANQYLQLWSEFIRQAKYKFGRKTLAGPLMVRDIDTQRVTGLYGPTT